MIVENPLRIIRELKGAPLSIVLCLQIVNTRVSQAWLEAQTGYTDKTISRGLDYLRENGLADHTSAGWQLCGTRQQLPMPLAIDDTTGEPIENTADVVVDIQGNSDGLSQSRRNSDSLLVSLVNTDSDNNNDSNKLTNNGEKRKNSDSEPFWDLLFSVGVRRNRATEQIAALDWVNCAYIQAMIEKLEGEGSTWPKDCGLLLYRLKQVPKPIRHGKNCQCNECDQKRRSRYAKDSTYQTA